MDLIYLRSFLEVARCQSFTKAAENLGYVQSSVTAQIQKLENEYGVVLFERFGRTMRLTSAGEQLRDTFVKILDIYDDSKRLISRQAKGNLEIGTIESLMSFYLPPLFHRFLQSFPDFNLQVKELSRTTMLQSIKSGVLDMGILIDHPIVDDDIETTVIRQEPLVLVAKPSHPLCSANTISVAELGSHNLIVTQLGCPYRAALERLLEQNGIAYNIHSEFGTLEAIKQCVSYGLGIALVPYISVIREISENRLVTLPFKHSDITFYTQIVHHKKKWLSPAVRHLIDLLAEPDNAPLSPTSTQIS